MVKSQGSLLSGALLLPWDLRALSSSSTFAFKYTLFSHLTGYKIPDSGARWTEAWSA